MTTERESGLAAAMRKAKLVRLQQHYDTFGVFLDDVMDLLGFTASAQQHDIGDYLANGPGLLMIQAQRGQAKSTITAAYAVWYLIHNPSARVLIISAADSLASEISNLIINIMATMPQLECMRPDKSAGDRTAGDGYDIHHTLKGVEKSPSVSCAGVTGTLTGKRADLLIADDIESPKNSRTATNRELLMHLTREFTALCTGKKGHDGHFIIEPRIVYLGTPQSSDSVYNTLPGRGFSVRIWPGRFPTQVEEKAYGDMLAPSIFNRMQDRPDLRTGAGPNMQQGQPTDSHIVNEEELTRKQVAEGAPYFQLQYMLCTQLADTQRYPLKTENLIVMRCSRDKMPMSLVRSSSVSGQVPYKSGNLAFTMAAPHGVSDDYGALQGCIMRVDPAGGGANADENGYAITGFLNGNIYALDIGGYPGGYSVPGLEALAEKAVQWKVTTIIIEKNMGFGAFKEVWMPVLRRCGYTGNVEEDMVYGQKELRIITTLEPIMARGALIINHSIVESDDQSLQKYDGTRRGTYSVFHQLSKITREAKCLFHDDRLDALEGAVRYWVPFLSIDEDKAAAAKKSAALKAFLKDPRGADRYSSPGQPQRNVGILNRYRR